MTVTNLSPDMRLTFTNNASTTATVPFPVVHLNNISVQAPAMTDADWDAALAQLKAFSAAAKATASSLTQTFAPAVQNLTLQVSNVSTQLTNTLTGYVWPDDDPSSPPRRRPPLEFNRYINASDLLEEFIDYLASEGVRQGEVLGIPLEVFVTWLVIRACEEDKEEPPTTLTLPPPRRQPRCLGCGKYMRAGTRLALHDDRCASRHFARAAA